MIHAEIVPAKKVNGVDFIIYYLVQIKSPRDDIKSPFGIRLIENSNFL